MEDLNKKTVNMKFYKSVNSLSFLLNKYSIMLFLFLTIKSFFSMLIRYNNNTIFSSEEKYFKFIIFKFSIENNWKIKFSIFSLFLYFIVITSEIFSSYYDKKSKKNLRDILSIDIPSYDYLGKGQEKDWIENFCSTTIDSFSGILVNFLEFSFELVFFYFSAEDRKIKTYGYLSFFLCSAFLFVSFKIFKIWLEKIKKFVDVSKKFKNQELLVYTLETFIKKFKNYFDSNFSILFFSLYYLIAYLVNSNSLFCEKQSSINTFLTGVGILTLSKKLSEFIKNIPNAKNTFFFYKKIIKKEENF